MYPYRHFKPSVNNRRCKKIDFVTEYNSIYGETGNFKRYCNNNIYNKNVPGSDSPSAKVSYATKIAQIIQSTKGGKTQYGNFYLGQPLNINYLGRMEGMPGGGGAPPLNRF